MFKVFWVQAICLKQSRLQADVESDLGFIKVFNTIWVQVRRLKGRGSSQMLKVIWFQPYVLSDLGSSHMFKGPVFQPVN